MLVIKKRFMKNETIWMAHGIVDDIHLEDGAVLSTGRACEPIQMRALTGGDEVPTRSVKGRRRPN